MNCPICQDQHITKNGFDHLQDGTSLQRYRCQACGKRWNERTGTPMARLRTQSSVVSFALNVRTEGMAARAAGRSFGFIPFHHFTVGASSGSADRPMVTAHPGGSGSHRGRG